jgi:hypothetical protein
MGTDGTANLLGIPVPSSDPAFLTLVIIHIGFGIVAVVSGAVAMLSRKGRGRHANFGTIYFWSLCGLSATMSVLSLMRWADDYHLFVLGALAFALACFGRLAIRTGHPRWHLAGMGLSYVVMLTAFYVDNGKNLPVWRDLPRVAYWIVPAAIGLPLIAYYLFRLPAFRR